MLFKCQSFPADNGFTTGKNRGNDPVEGSAEKTTTDGYMTCQCSICLMEVQFFCSKNQSGYFLNFTPHIKKSGLDTFSLGDGIFL